MSSLLENTGSAMFDPSRTLLYQAIENYVPCQDGEMALAEGDLVSDVRILGNGWALGKNLSRRGTVGVFKLRCTVQVVTESEAERSSGSTDQRDSSPDRPTTASINAENDDVIALGEIPEPTEMTSSNVPISTVCNNDVLTEPNEGKYDDVVDKNVDESTSLTSSPNAGNKRVIPKPHPAKHGATYGAYYPSPKPHMLVKPRPGKLSTTIAACRRCPAGPDDDVIIGIPGAQSVTSGPANLNDGCEASPRQQRGAEIVRNLTLPAAAVALHCEPVYSKPVKRCKSSCNCSAKLSSSCTNSLSNSSQHHPSNQHVSTTPFDFNTYVNSTATGTPSNCGCSCTMVTRQLPAEMLERSEEDNRTNEDSMSRGYSNQLPPPPLPEKIGRYADIKRRLYKDYRAPEYPACASDAIYSEPSAIPIVVDKPPMLPVRRGGNKVYDSRGNAIVYKESAPEQKVCRLFGSFVSAIVVGGAVFAWMHYCLLYSLAVSLAIGVLLAAFLTVLLSVSCYVRCMLAILLPSLSTTRGRLSFLLVISGFLLTGPVSNIYVNLHKVADSMGCSIEQSYNQTMLLMRPFDAMMVQVNRTLHDLQVAAHEVNSGLMPLDAGLEQVEMDVSNGKLQLMGTRKTCMSLVDRAYNACSSGMNKAQDQCLGVMSALGMVYNHAREVLDRINPDRWAPKQLLILKKRQVQRDESNDDLELGVDDQDICEPLDTHLVCHSLNDSGALCQPSNWAGEAIQEAVNTTQDAMKRLQTALQFYVTSQPYNDTRENALKLVFKIRQQVRDDFLANTAYFELVVFILHKLVPLAIVLLVYVSHNYVHKYLVSDEYDNFYVTDQFKILDQQHFESTGHPLLPLKKSEENFVVRTDIVDTNPPEEGLCRVGMTVLVLHLLLSFTVYMFDYVLYWVLVLVDTHGRPGFDVTGRDSLEMVVTGEGIIVQLLDIFFQGFHPTGEWFNYTTDTNACLPRPSAPSMITLFVLSGLYSFLLLSVLLKAYLFRLRNKITGYFFPDRRRVRLVHLYNSILARRSRYPGVLCQTARSNYRRRQLHEQISICHRLACAVCRAVMNEPRVCLVCGCKEDHSFRDCQTERCRGLYCMHCFNDLERQCPLCQHDNDQTDDDEVDESMTSYRDLATEPMKSIYRESLAIEYGLQTIRMTSQ